MEDAVVLVSCFHVPFLSPGLPCYPWSQYILGLAAGLSSTDWHILVVKLRLA